MQIQYYRSALVLLFALHGLFAISQEYTVDIEHYGIEEGLQHRNILSIHEDSDGILWLGGEKGLQRFDGHSFKTWTKADKSGRIFYINNITEDEEGWLWLWNNDIQRYVFLHTQTEEIITPRERFGDVFPEELEENSKNRERFGNQKKIQLNKKQLVFPISSPAKIIFYKEENNFEHVMFKDSKNIGVILGDRSNHIWCKLDSTIIKINESGEIISSWSFKKDDYIETIIESSKNIIANVNGTLHLLEGDAKFEEKLNQFQEGNHYKIESFRFINGNYWVMNSGEWLLFSEDNLELIFSLTPESIEEDFFKNIYHFVDSKNRLWIYGDWGLYQVSIKESKFKKHFFFEDDRAKSFNNSVRGIWVGEDDIFANFEWSRPYKVNRSENSNWFSITDKRWVRPIIKRKSGGFWMAAPFHIFSTDDQGIQTDSLQIREQIEINGIWSLYEDPNERLWIGASHSLIFIEKDSRIARQFKAEGEDFGLNSRKGAIQNFVPDNDGTVWLCSWSGLYHVDLDNNKVLARYGYDETGTKFLPGDIFYHMHIDTAGIYWIATNQGLIRWSGPAVGIEQSNETQQKSYSLFTRADNLANEVIYAVYEDDFNRIWMSSDFGIMSINKETYQVNSYLEKDGISHNEFNRISHFQEPNGTIYFGGLNGITSFHPKDFYSKAEEQIKMVITDYEIFDGESSELINKTSELRQDNRIIFKPKDRFFRLNFALPTYESDQKILYAWKIEGIDSKWNYQHDNGIQIGHLPYGEHNLRIKGQSASTGWSKHELNIEIHVWKPFYLQIWFIAFCLLGIILGTLGFIRLRTSVLEKEVDKATAEIQKKTLELQRIDDLKTKFFANVSHELRTPLTLILGPLESLKREANISVKGRNMLERASSSGQDLMDLINSILDISKIDEGQLALNEKPILLYPFIQKIFTSFESHAQEKQILFQFDYNVNVQDHLMIDASKLERVLVNLLFNAFKFTKTNGSVRMELKEDKENIHISIIDTGIGIDKEDIPHIFDRYYMSKNNALMGVEGTGIGLSLVKDYTNIMNGRMLVSSKINVGSVFSLIFPKKVVTSRAEKVQFKNSNVEIESLSKKKYNILIVEDNYKLRTYLTEILEGLYHVNVAVNGEEALHILKSNVKIDLLITDFMMPVMDGYDLVKQIKSELSLLDISIIMLSARGDAATISETLKLGVNKYIEKPFEEQHLLEEIDSLLSKKINI